MNIQVAKKDLAQVVARMVSVAEKKTTMPVLSNALLRVDGSRLVFIATDLYQSLTTSIPADVAKPGSLAVPAKELFERTKMMPDGPIELSAKENSLVLKSKGSARRYTMRAMNGDDFPPIPEAKSDVVSTAFDVGALSKLIALTIFSISQDETRPHLNSLMIEWADGVLRAVSTDGHRLSRAEVKLPIATPGQMLIPLKSLREVQKMCDELYAIQANERPSIGVVQSSATAFFASATSSLSVKLVDAQFPPWRQVVPASSARTFRVPRVALADAIKAVSIAAAERTGGVKFSFSKGVMSITSESPESGEGADELPYEVIDGKDTAIIGLNAKYPLDALGALACDEVDLGLSGELDPLTIKPVGPMADESIFVLMPMRI